MSQTPIDDLLKIKVPVDEVEESPDRTMQEETAAAETPKPEAASPKPAAEAAKTETQPAQTTEQPKGETEDDRVKRMTALPKWAHERLRANDDRTTAAERRAEASERRVRELEQQFQDTGQQPQEPEYDPRAEVAQGLYETRVELGWDWAVEKYGSDYASQATHWANDRAQADSGFYQQIMKTANPVKFAITEFRKAQFASEAEKADWDIEKLIANRAAPTTQQVVAPLPTVQPQATQPAAGDKGASRQPSISQPSDFAAAASGAGRTTPTWAGPTPLGQLLKLPGQGKR